LIGLIYKRFKNETSIPVTYNLKDSNNIVNKIY